MGVLNYYKYSPLREREETKEKKIKSYNKDLYILIYFHMYTVEFFDTWLINASWWSFNWTPLCVRSKDGEQENKRVFREKNEIKSSSSDLILSNE